MPFQAGQKRPASAGRRKGVGNKRTRDLIEILDKAGYCPIADLIEVAAIARKEYERSEEIFDLIQEKRVDVGMMPLSESEAPTYLKIIQTSAAQIAPYVYPKKKSVEIKGEDGKDLFESLTAVFKKLADGK